MGIPFGELVDGMDELLQDELGDVATINGVPVRGYFGAPWLQPRMGQVKTGLREPHFQVTAAIASGAAKGDIVHIDLPAPDGGDFTLVELQPDGTGMVNLVLRRC